ncbi:2-amino-4-hydroxy-6-hydroxymethyldihydropteridine diphosphokinase [Eionea flava]
MSSSLSVSVLSKKVVLGLGSNTQQEAHFRYALDALSEHLGELCVSPIYKSAPKLSQKNKSPTAMNDMASYYNAVVLVDSDWSVPSIKNLTRDIEQQCGRDRTNPQVVSIDIDFLLYGDAVIHQDDVVLPHPDIAVCDYVLRPLSDIWPTGLCPQAQKEWLALWHEMLERKSKLLSPSDLYPVDFIWRDRVISVSPPCVSL